MGMLMIVRRLFDLVAVVGSAFAGLALHRGTPSFILTPSPLFGASEVLPADCGIIFIMLMLHELLRQSEAIGILLFIVRNIPFLYCTEYSITLLLHGI